MKKSTREGHVFEWVHELMPDAPLEEKQEVSAQFWKFFDALWAIADRQINEERAARETRDKTAPSDSLESTTHA